MYFILKGDDRQFYLLPNSTYALERPEADILIAEDDTISDRHAVFVTSDDEVSIASIHGTFLNQTKLKPLDKHKLNDNDTLKFGNQTIFRFQKVTIINTASGIGGTLKRRLIDIMARMGGLLLGKWSMECNFVTVTEITFTNKVLFAVIVGTPIVTLQYWEDYLCCLQRNEPLPDPLRYFPKYSEELKNQNISLKYKEERKNVFKNKIFIFTNRNDKEMMEPLIKLAGGHAQFWDEEPIITVPMGTSVYILMQAADLNDTMQQDEKLSNFVDNFLSAGYRTVPYIEIALAIVHCSCKEYCNPTVIEEQEGNEDQLANPSQSINVKDEIISISDDSNDNKNSSGSVHILDSQSLNDSELQLNWSSDRSSPILLSPFTQTNTADEELNSSATNSDQPSTQIYLPD